MGRLIDDSINKNKSKNKDYQKLISSSASSSRTPIPSAPSISDVQQQIYLSDSSANNLDPIYPDNWPQPSNLPQAPPPPYSSTIIANTPSTAITPQQIPPQSIVYYVTPATMASRSNVVYSNHLQQGHSPHLLLRSSKRPKHPCKSIKSCLMVIAFSLIAYQIFQDRTCVGAKINSVIFDQKYSVDDIRNTHLFLAGIAGIMCVVACLASGKTYDPDTNCLYKMIMFAMGLFGFLSALALTFVVLTTPCPQNVVTDINNSLEMVAKTIVNGRDNPLDHTVFHEQFKDVKGIIIFCLDLMSTLLMIDMSFTACCC